MCLDPILTIATSSLVSHKWSCRLGRGLTKYCRSHVKKIFMLGLPLFWFIYFILEKCIGKRLVVHLAKDSLVVGSLGDTMLWIVYINIIGIRATCSLTDSNASESLFQSFSQWLWVAGHDTSSLDMLSGVDCILLKGSQNPFLSTTGWWAGQPT